MTAEQEAKVDRKIEDHFKGHRMFPNGRDYRCFIQHAITEEDRENYRTNFDLVFPHAPGAGI